MKVVLDTNIIVSAAISRQGIPAQLVLAWTEGSFELVVSLSLFEELAATFRKERLSRYFAWTPAEIEAFLNAIRASGPFVEPQARIDAVSRDPDDNRVLEVAVAGEADYIVTGDKDLLDLQSFGGIEIVTPARFLAILRLEQL